MKIDWSTGSLQFWWVCLFKQQKCVLLTETEQNFYLSDSGLFTLNLWLLWNPTFMSVAGTEVCQACIGEPSPNGPKSV